MSVLLNQLTAEKNELLKVILSQLHPFYRYNRESFIQQFIYFEFALIEYIKNNEIKVAVRHSLIHHLKTIEQIKALFSKEMTPEDINAAIKWYLDDYFKYAFDDQLLKNDSTNSEIKLSNGIAEALSLQFKSAHNYSITYQRDAMAYEDVTLIDSPIILQLGRLFRRKRYRLKRNDKSGILDYPIYEDIVYKLLEPSDSRFKEIYDSILLIQHKILEAIQGSLGYDEIKDDLVYTKQINKEGEEMDVALINTASGIKALGTLALMIEKGHISPSKLLIIDEPEAHLHPKWEVLYGRVLLELAHAGVPIVVSTHSGTILESIMRASEQLEVEELVHYYVGEHKPAGVSFDDVTKNKAETFRKIADAERSLIVEKFEKWQ